MKVIIIDDDPIVVESLKTIVTSNNIQVLATGYDGSVALSLYKKHRPDLVMLDIRMKDISGIQASKDILTYHSQAKILLITTFEDRKYIDEALTLGCRGYILKENIKGIIPALNAIYSGNIVFDSKIIKNLGQKIDRKKIDSLSPRDNQILYLIAEGLNNQEIADRLFLSEGTVRNYVSQLLNSLELRDRTQLAIYYYKHK